MNNGVTDRNKVLCWHCNRALVGRNGSWKARPLLYATVKTQDGYPVKVHKVCAADANKAMRYLTAQPKSAAQWDAQLEDQLGAD